MPQQNEPPTHDHDCENCKNVSRSDGEEKWACVICGRKFLPMDIIRALIITIKESILNLMK